MGEFRIEVSIGGIDASKTHYYIEAESDDQAKAFALDKYIKETLPQFLTVAWEGPLSVLKAVSAEDKPQGP